MHLPVSDMSIFDDLGLWHSMHAAQSTVLALTIVTNRVVTNSHDARDSHKTAVLVAQPQAILLHHIAHRLAYH
eukprot:6183900-Pleurochrysis_carterae.AAC.3